MGANNSKVLTDLDKLINIEINTHASNHLAPAAHEAIIHNLTLLLQVDASKITPLQTIEELEKLVGLRGKYRLHRNSTFQDCSELREPPYEKEVFLFDKAISARMNYLKLYFKEDEGKTGALLDLADRLARLDCEHPRILPQDEVHDLLDSKLRDYIDQTHPKIEVCVMSSGDYMRLSHIERIPSIRP